MALAYRVIQNGVIRRSACYVVAAHLQAAIAGAATLVLRDGIDAVAEVRVSLSAAAGLTEQQDLKRMLFYHGVYATITGAPDFAQIELEPV